MQKQIWINEEQEKHLNRYQEAFNIYVNKQRWVGGQSNVYAYKVNVFFLSTSFVYEEWAGGPQSPKFCLRSD